MSESWIQAALKKARDEDDVFRDEFLHRVLFIADAHETLDLDQAAQRYLTNLGANWIGTVSKDTNLRAGPHIERDGSLIPVLRVFDDSHGAFLQALSQDDAGFAMLPPAQRKHDR